MPRFYLYIPENPGKDHFLKQMETLEKLIFEKVGIKLTPSKLIIYAVDTLILLYKIQRPEDVKVGKRNWTDYLFRKK